MRTARARFQEAVAETLTDWRLGCIPSRQDWSIERELFRSGIAEILSLRLRIAYMPLLQGLQRIENRVDILVNLREDPYAPPVSLRGRYGHQKSRKVSPCQSNAIPTS